MPLAHLVDPFKQVKLFVTEEHEETGNGNGNGEKGGSTGEMVIEDNDEEEMREIEVTNVTRAGCEKANVNQFELLRVLGQVRRETGGVTRQRKYSRLRLCYYCS